VTTYDISGQVRLWENRISNVLQSNDASAILHVINSLYMIRKNSIAVDGEYGKGNQLFKELRNSGLLQQLKDAYDKSVDRDLSLEQLQK
jgi:hypothetical protein